jgi:hypothetical protein
MKISTSLIAAAAMTLLPLAVIAGDKDKSPAPMGTASKAQFDTLDTDRDGRLSPTEAASDSKIVFRSADKNGDGYLDNAEFSHRDMSHPQSEQKSEQQSESNSAASDRDAPKPRQ